ncbi:hypothetical protein GOV14_05720 [Candidatus Pacearchaeota archaeon]|nr:hypothetical protein [Candidatus Pacearchaeota archaeon]
MEYLILVGFLTIIITGILGIGLYYSTTSGDQLKETQIHNFGNKVVGASRTVFYAGEPSKATIYPFLPEGISGIDAVYYNGLYYLLINITASSGEQKLSFKSDVPIMIDSSNPITIASGVKMIIIEADASHAVISQG